MLLALLVAVATVTGTVTFGGSPLAGVAVTLHSGSYDVVCITDARGAYAFENVPTGSYELTAALDGLPAATRSGRAAAGPNVIDAIDMTPKPLGCLSDISFCSDKPPATRFDRPSCNEFNLDMALIASARRGDRSAIELLRRHYETTFTYDERYLIAGTLLGRVSDDGAIWSEVSEHAERLIAAGAKEEKLAAYAKEHGYEACEYASIAWSALGAIAEDRRARPLLLRALASDDVGLAELGIFGLASQRDAPPLAELEAALTRYPNLASDLAAFDSDAVEALAMKFLETDEQRAEYRERRTEYREEK